MIFWWRCSPICCIVLAKHRMFMHHWLLHRMQKSIASDFWTTMLPPHHFDIYRRYKNLRRLQNNWDWISIPCLNLSLRTFWPSCGFHGHVKLTGIHVLGILQSKLCVGGTKLLEYLIWIFVFHLLWTASWRKLSKDRREAPPLPLWVIFHWEGRILQGASTPYEVMMLGAFLLITWAGLRFADAQRLSVDSLVFNFQELRGLVWRSKTMAAGHPFGAQAAGLCCDSACWWNFISFNAKKKLRATSRRALLFYRVRLRVLRVHEGLWFCLLGSCTVLLRGRRFWWLLNAVVFILKPVQTQS